MTNGEVDFNTYPRSGDAFDRRLTAAFAAAAPTDPGDVFTRKIEARLAGADGFQRKRWVILGSAGSVGSAFAGSQLEAIMAGLPMPQGAGAYAEFIAAVGPETLAAAVVAVPLAFLAWMLAPARV